MLNYQTMYAILCGAISDAIDVIEKNNAIEAQFIMQNAILQTEEMYIRDLNN